jgi:hypothetical protein
MHTHCILDESLSSPYFKPNICFFAHYQLLQWLSGMMQHHHHATFTPQFCKQYAKVGHVIQEALGEYRDDVTEGRYETHIDVHIPLAYPTYVHIPTTDENTV